ncbi:cell-cell adhesion glycoprotein [Anaeramoeba ignava]|uniref:Cell-cell adhesion glycoprotein n=1 Tax=Anaeramoeba ignava TaxID=1746090 RepID=A0A9Q0LH19_ANAIG|nr:cell-cell adhesion glycoprotein [Anaeramoeba ignava]
MKKLFLLFVFFFSLAYSVVSDCQHVHLGEACDESSNIYCYDNLKCFNNTCSYQNDGADCQLGTDCTSGYCYQNKCIPAFLLPGDSCEINEQCPTTLSCNNGICTGAAIGQPCGSSSYGACAAGSFCMNTGSNYVCVESLSPGETCSTQFAAISSTAEALNLCKDFKMCMQNTQSTSFICDTMFTREVNQGCTHNMACKLGLYCDNPGVTGVCKSYDDTTISCTADSQCPFGTVCNCTSGYCITVANTNANTEIQDGLSCLAQTNCVIHEDVFTMGACPLDSCLDKLKAIQCAMSNNHADTFYPPYYWDCNKSNSATGIILSFALMLACLFFIF